MLLWYFQYYFQREQHIYFVIKMFTNYGKILVPICTHHSILYSACEKSNFQKGHDLQMTTKT